MKKTTSLAFAVAYGVVLGYLFTIALGHMLSLWPGPDWFALTMRTGVPAWIALILLSAWVGNRYAAATSHARSPGRRPMLLAAVAILGIISGIVVADSLLAVISLVAGTSIRISRTGLLTALCLAWLAFGAAGAVLATRVARRYIRIHTP